MLLLTVRSLMTRLIVSPDVLSVTLWPGTTTVMPSAVISADDSSEAMGTNSTASIATTATMVIVLLNDMF